MRNRGQLHHPAAFAPAAAVQRPGLYQGPGKVAALHLQPQQQLAKCGLLGVLLRGDKHLLFQRIEVLFFAQRILQHVAHVGQLLLILGHEA